MNFVYKIQYKTPFDVSRSNYIISIYWKLCSQIAHPVCSHINSIRNTSNWLYRNTVLAHLMQGSEL
ncbi:hypothetical protein D3OALGA1CA_459 [Olavius algarvensis associated proteobacterium Delta 3]|nr:hypothetical protein D3OALGB2SA_479 [Olavius algarvensis associated proteobacterium Delta 3]CAB5084533.1 hypothetical protein D3OALGA1CA_459 [Olavius algarvensis associated proteobacterium Delta 3]